MESFRCWCLSRAWLVHVCSLKEVRKKFYTMGTLVNSNLDTAVLLYMQQSLKTLNIVFLFHRQIQKPFHISWKIKIKNLFQQRLMIQCNPHPRIVLFIATRKSHLCKHYHFHLNLFQTMAFYAVHYKWNHSYRLCIQIQKLQTKRSVLLATLAVLLR